MLMQLAVFDLDYTVWQPEMYQLHGPPKLVNLVDMQPKRRRKKRPPSPATIAGSRTIKDGTVVVDQSGTPITVFEGA